MKQFLILILAVLLSLVVANDRIARGNLKKCETVADCDNSGETKFDCISGRCRVPKPEAERTARQARTVRRNAPKVNGPRANNNARITNRD